MDGGGRTASGTAVERSLQRILCPPHLHILVLRNAGADAEGALALARRMRAIGVPSIAARLRRNCPKDGPHDVGQFDASPGMDCQRTP
jgi:hypothetical protein